MKPFTLLLIGLFALASLTVVPAESIAQARPARQGGMQSKAMDAKGMKVAIRKAEIVSLVIGTESDGTWNWTAVVKNTGTAKILKSTMIVQGIQGSSAASGSQLPGDLAPGQSVAVKRLWTRCCSSTLLKVDLYDNAKTPHAVISTKTVRIPIIRMKVAAIRWSRGKKQWLATVKNDTPLSIKIVIQGVASHANPVHWVGAGGFTRVVPPHGTITQTGSWAAYQPGDLLGVELRYMDQGWCGGPGWCKIDYKQITLP